MTMRKGRRLPDTRSWEAARRELELACYAMAAAGKRMELAAGGIVSRPTHALIGESGPEAVIPLGRGGGWGGTITVNVGSVDSHERIQEIVRAVSTAILKQARSTGNFTYGIAALLFGPHLSVFSAMGLS